MRKIIASLAAGGAIAALWFGTSSASADAAPGGREACNAGAFCLYYDSPAYGWGSFAHWYAGQFSVAGYDFGNYGNGAGFGQQVWHNAAGFVNNTSHLVWVCSTQAPQCFMTMPGDAGAIPLYMKNRDESVMIGR